MLWKLSSVQDHVRRLFGDIGSSYPHGDADLCRLEGRSIVDPVSGHGYDMPLPLQGLDYAVLMFG